MDGSGSQTKQTEEDDEAYGINADGTGAVF
jgi:hypothetical protein